MYNKSSPKNIALWDMIVDKADCVTEQRQRHLNFYCYVPFKPCKF